MKINADKQANSLSAENQVNEKLQIFEGESGAKRILFLGNSITLHEYAPHIGWHHSWGMAASEREKDYLHLVVKRCEEKFGSVSYCICNVGKWEQHFSDERVIEEFAKAKEFGADIVIARLGENVPVEGISGEEFYQSYQAFLRYYTQGASRVIVTDLFWEHELLDGAIERLCADEGYEFVSIRDLGYDENNKAIGQFENVSVNLHPNDRGMAKIAQRILEKI